MPASPTFASLADEQFVSLTTFRKTGAPVATAVWVARHDDAIVVTTGASSGKVKRLRNDARVEMRPCSRSGSVAPGTPAVAGSAEVLGDDAAAAKPLAEKYGVQYRVALLAEKVLRRGGGGRTILRITPA